MEFSGWGAYIDAVVRIEAPGGVIWVRPGPVSQTSGEYPEPEGRAICVITAHNPGGRLTGEAENASAQARLEAELERRGLTWWPAAGGDPSWTHVEASVAVIGMTEADAIALGAQFGQEAIFVLTPAERLVVGCAERRIAATGWTAESAAGTGEADEDPEDAEPPHYPIVDVTVHEENFLTGEKAAGFSDFDDYLDWIGKHEGLLCTLRHPEGSITLHGDGTGSMMISGTSDWTEGPFTATGAIKHLADAGVFGLHVDVESAAWGAGDVAALVGPYLEHAEFKIDDMVWSGTNPWISFEFNDEKIALASARWDIGSGASPGGSDWGIDYLLRIGPGYVVYQWVPGETIRLDWDVPNDEAAVAKFIADFGPPAPDTPEGC